MLTTIKKALLSHDVDAVELVMSILSRVKIVDLTDRETEIIRILLADERAEKIAKEKK